MCICSDVGGGGTGDFSPMLSSYFYTKLTHSLSNANIHCYVRKVPSNAYKKGRLRGYCMKTCDAVVSKCM